MRTISTTAACAMLHLTPDTLGFLVSAGPLEPLDGTLSPRQVFGIALLLNLGMLPVGDAVPIAVNAAFDAREGGTRLLCVSWPDRAPVARWMDSFPAAERQPHLPLLAIPADAMLDQMISRIDQHLTAAAKRMN